MTPAGGTPDDFARLIVGGAQTMDGGMLRQANVVSERN